MPIDFSQYQVGAMKLMDFMHAYSLHDLMETATAQADALIALVQPLTDAQVTHIPNDPQATEGDGWSVAHLILHMTASVEEAVAVSSILARGISYPFEPRLRYEADWQTVLSTAQCLARLHESRRMRVAYLSAWPDQPNFDTRREVPPPLKERFGDMDVMASVGLGLRHEFEHMPQVREAIRQAVEASGK